MVEGKLYHVFIDLIQETQLVFKSSALTKVGSNNTLIKNIYGKLAKKSL